ncbi:hypothetical protein FisN_25Lu090, partial [Fistulifera solaris]
IFWERE